MEELFESLLKNMKLDWKHQWNEVSLLLIILFYCIINVIKHNSNRGGSHIDLPNWIKNKTAKINPINKKDSKNFQYVVPVV